MIIYREKKCGKEESRGERSVSFDVWELGRNVIKRTAVEAQPVPKRRGIRLRKPSNPKIKCPLPGVCGWMPFSIVCVCAFVCCHKERVFQRGLYGIWLSKEYGGAYKTFTPQERSETWERRVSVPVYRHQRYAMRKGKAKGNQHTMSCEYWLTL